MTKPRPQQTLGAHAEAAVVSFLQEHGYEVLATNLHLGRLELDIVARQGTTLVVVEVRTRGRTAWTSGFGSIDPKKRARIRRAGERLWQRRFRDDPSVERMRFDAASVSLHGTETRVEYVVAAF